MTINAKNIIFRAGDFEGAATISAQEFLDTINAKIEADGRARHPILWQDGKYNELIIENVGQKYIRIVSVHPSQPSSRSVYCFLDYEGNIFKAEGWKKPAKHIRGTVFHDDCSWGRGLGPYGAAYL